MAPGGDVMLPGWNEGAGCELNVPEAEDDAVDAEELAVTYGDMYEVDAGSAFSCRTNQLPHMQSIGGAAGCMPTSFTEMLLGDWDGFDMRSALLTPGAAATSMARASRPAWNALGDGAKDASSLHALLADIAGDN